MKNKITKRSKKNGNSGDIVGAGVGVVIGGSFAGPLGTVIGGVLGGFTGAVIGNVIKK